MNFYNFKELEKKTIEGEIKLLEFHLKKYEENNESFLNEIKVDIDNKKFELKRKNPIIFFHIFKTGGRSLKDIILTQNLPIIHLHGSPKTINGKKLITIIRNPITRFVSCFNHMLHVYESSENNYEKMVG